jgi:uncharacterized protein YozE (UPF0346 family)
VSEFDNFYEKYILQNASHLTKQVHEQAFPKVQKLFKEKIREINECIKD